MSLAARSPAQAAVFAGAREELEQLARAAGASGGHPLAEDLAALTGRLTRGQAEWSGAAQRYGVIATVPTRRLHRERFARAVRACSGRGPVRSALPGPDALHTPHDVAEHVRKHAGLLVPRD